MTTISENLKALRKHHQMTQDQFAKKLGIKRSSIGAYEEGRAEPPLSNLSNIAKSFHVSIDDLVNQNFKSRLGINPLTGQKQNKTSSIGGVKLKVLALTVDRDNNEYIDFIAQKAAAGYLNGYSDPEFLQDMPKFHLPHLKNGTYRAFEISGDSMLPVQNGSIIIGQYLESMLELKNGERYVIVSKNEGIVFKRIYVGENNKITLVSDNKAYSEYDMNGEDLLEIWKASSMISNEIPEPREELGISEIKDSLGAINKELASIKKKIS